MHGRLDFAQPATRPPSGAEENAMKNQRLPHGWTQKRIRELAKYHDRQTEEGQAAEIKAAIAQDGQTVMVVPTKLVPKILRLISQKRTA
jgi:hypothetical protein